MKIILRTVLFAFLFMLVFNMIGCGAEYDTDPNLMADTVDLCNFDDTDGGNKIKNMVTTNKADFTETLINGEFEANDNYYFCREVGDNPIEFALCDYDNGGSIWVSRYELDLYPDHEKCLTVGDLPNEES